ncbi:MAG: hypothetical protein II028_03350 [Clostridia bacterium]|jgi:hypothetical protein|nr:hypothetical protein [Clostridia bacterium]
MRYQIMQDRLDGAGFQPFFETEDFQEAKDFAMRLAYFSDRPVYVYDAKVGDRIRDFSDPKYQN